MNVVAKTYALKDYDKIVIQAQKDETSCGFTALSMVLQYYGISLSQEQLQTLQDQLLGHKPGLDFTHIDELISSIKASKASAYNYMGPFIGMERGKAQIITTAPDAISGGWPLHALIPVEVYGYFNLTTNTFTSTGEKFIDPAWGGGFRTISYGIYYNTTTTPNNPFGSFWNIKK